MISKLTLITFLLINISQNSFSQPDNIGNKWNLLDKKVSDVSIDTDFALQLLKLYEKEIRKYFREKKGVYIKRNDWVYPLKNFTSIYYRSNGKDYLEDHFDYFQGSEFRGHPAHDIMILDSNKDLLDDSTLKPVDVVSMSSGVVVATDTTWKPGSYLRGGKFVKIFDVTNNGIFYYSHLSVVNVMPGDIVTAGDKIGEVGRTGRNAIQKTGKTHLHIAFLISDDGYPMPEDIWIDLKRAENLQKK